MKANKMNPSLRCPIHAHAAYLSSGAAVYPHRPDLRDKPIWRCPDDSCTYRVGCHPGTTKPLGSLADNHTRLARMEAHQYLDHLWRSGGFEKRAHAYTWLAQQLCIAVKDCHIGLFDVPTCERVVRLCKGGRFKPLDTLNQV